MPDTLNIDNINLLGQQGLGIAASEKELTQQEFPEDRTVFGIQVVPAAERAKLKLAREEQNLTKLGKMFELSDRIIQRSHTLEGPRKEKFLSSTLPSLERVFPGISEQIRVFAEDPGGYKKLQSTITDPQQKAVMETIARTGDLMGAVDYVIKATTKGKGQTINIGQQETAFRKELGKKTAQQLVENKEKAIMSAQSIIDANESIKLLDSGVITGTGAEYILNLGRFLKRFGYTGEAIENTQAFVANQGRQVLNILGSGALGAGTGISDNDRNFARDIAGGNITLDERAIRRIIRLNARVAKNVIERHNREARGIKNPPVELTVEMPKFLGKALDQKDRYLEIKEENPKFTDEQIYEQMINEGF